KERVLVRPGERFVVAEADFLRLNGGAQFTQSAAADILYLREIDCRRPFRKRSYVCPCALQPSDRCGAVGNDLTAHNGQSESWWGLEGSNHTPEHQVGIQALVCLPVAHHLRWID